MPVDVLNRNNEPQTESFRELLSQLANGSAALVRDEIDLAKQEIAEKIASLRTGIVAVVIGAVIGLMALMALCAALIIALSKPMGPGLAALVTGVALAIIAGIVAMAGLKKLKSSKLKPDKTIRTLKEDKEWLKQMT
jgi:uncharacterized membrane protein YqjE